MLSGEIPQYETFPEWKTLIDACVAELEALESIVQLVQIKEKFGQLRIYIRAYDAKDIWSEETYIAADEIINKYVALVDDLEEDLAQTRTICDTDNGRHVSPHKGCWFRG